MNSILNELALMNNQLMQNKYEQKIRDSWQKRIEKKKIIRVARNRFIKCLRNKVTTGQLSPVDAKKELDYYTQEVEYLSRSRMK